MEKYTDSALVAQLQSGHTSAFNPLVKKYQIGIHTFILKMVKDTDLAEDLTQDTFLRGFEYLTDYAKPYDVSGNFKNWLYRIAYNLCMDHFKKLRQQSIMMNRVLLEQLDVYQQSPEEVQIALDRQLAIQTCIHHLSDEQKEFIFLRMYGGLLLKDIAVLTDTCLDTIKGRKRYVLRNLAKLLKIERHATHMFAGQELKRRPSSPLQFR